ncbi:hypothetical protein BC834DRAFT_394552 [Gloeopeniophorella convolvens]|nr:hypothetical protein BC834DRAFT_394552 [Gloeopeniophorella convolvens]
MSSWPLEDQSSQEQQRSQTTPWSAGAPAASPYYPPYLPDIYVDGCIAYTFGPRCTETYLRYLFKAPSEPSLLRWNVEGWPGACTTAQAIPGTVSQPLLIEEGQPRWLLDYNARPWAGTIIRQRLWAPPGDAARRKYVDEAALLFPIFFVQIDGTVGLSLRDATEGRGLFLRLADTPAPVGSVATTHIRILWPGFERDPFVRQIQLRDDTNNRNPITLARLAQHVGRSVDKFYKDYKDREGCDANWRLGEGGVEHRRIILLGIVHVSAGTWQPLLMAA